MSEITPQLIIHQRLCLELVKIAKNAPDKDMTKSTGFMDMMNAIDILERLYPELKSE